MGSVGLLGDFRECNLGGFDGDGSRTHLLFPGGRVSQPKEWNETFAHTSIFVSYQNGFLFVYLFRVMTLILILASFLSGNLENVCSMKIHDFKTMRFWLKIVPVVLTGAKINKTHTHTLKKNPSITKQD